MDKFFEFTFRKDNLISSNNIITDFMSTFRHYNGESKCKDDENKNLKTNKNFINYVMKWTIFGNKMSQMRLNIIFTSIYFIIITFYSRINLNIIVLSCMVMVVEKDMVWDIAPNRKTKGDSAMKPTSFNSIFYGDCSPIIISCISEGFYVGKASSITTSLFSD